MQTMPVDLAQIVEWEKCALSPSYFIDTYCHINDPAAGDWIPFRLWKAQRRVLRGWERHPFNIDLKARQVGLTWLALAYGLHGMIFKPIYEFLIFSRREDEALYLASEQRLRGMYARLPTWMQAERIVVDDKSHLRLSNGSGARAFPSNAGDSYSANLAVIDEADLVPDLARLLGSVKPTIDAGGKLILISRVDKNRPESPFKKIYLAAKAGENRWNPDFIPWYAHPNRTPEWYENEKAESLHNTGALDYLHEQYPATDTEALAGKTLNKRINPQWLEAVYQEQKPLSEALLRNENAPPIPGLQVYRLPVPGRRYAGGVDPAEGNPNSDDSAAVFLDAETGEEVAMLSGKFQPSTLAAHVDTLGRWFNNAAVLIERNNHGHAVLLALREHSRLIRLHGWDDTIDSATNQRKEGWLSNPHGKALLYTDVAVAVRDQQVLIHSVKCWKQLESIDGSTLRAPEGLMDDCADAFALAWEAVRKPRGILVG